MSKEEQYEKRTDPIWFDKPYSSIITDKGQCKVKKGANIHHEVEFGILIGQTCKNVALDDWKKVVKGYFVGLDFTDRIYQGRAKDSAGPWSLSKGQDFFCGLSDFYTDVNAVQDVQDLQLRLEVNGKER
jgi:acylpyruvate hydrolase